jgi:hypothetical protein
MRTQRWTTTLTLIAGLLAAPVVASGCYSGYHHSHEWNDSEVTFYAQWETDTHREHRAYDQRTPDEQRAYWTWRDSHGG